MQPTVQITQILMSVQREKEAETVWWRGGLWSTADDFVIELAEQHTDEQTPKSQPKSIARSSADH